MTTQTITSKLILETWGLPIQVPGDQPRLFVDSDTVLRKTKFRSTGDRAFDKRVVAFWWMNIYVPNGHGDNDTPYDTYCTWSNACYKFKYVSQSGYNTGTGQAMPRVALVKFKKLGPQLAEFLEWHQYVKPSDHRDVGRCRVFSIMEESLSEHGSYEFFVRDDETSFVGLCRYSSFRIHKELPSIEAGVDFIRQNLFYKER